MNSLGSSIESDDIVSIANLEEVDDKPDDDIYNQHGSLLNLDDPNLGKEAESLDHLADVRQNDNTIEEELEANFRVNKLQNEKEMKDKIADKDEILRHLEDLCQGKTVILRSGSLNSLSKKLNEENFEISKTNYDSKAKYQRRVLIDEDESSIRRGNKIICCGRTFKSWQALGGHKAKIHPTKTKNNKKDKCVMKKECSNYSQSTSFCSLPSATSTPTKKDSGEYKEEADLSFDLSNF